MQRSFPCFMCEAVTPNWVLWSNARGETYYFCDSDCLSQWIKRQLRDIAMEINFDCANINAVEQGLEPKEETPWQHL